MGKRCWPKWIVQATCDKKFCNKTMLHYYKHLKEAAEALNGKKKKKMKGNCAQRSQGVR